MKRIPKRYLGDGVYVERDEYGDVILSAANNRIVLAPSVYAAFIKFLEQEKEDANQLPV